MREHPLFETPHAIDLGATVMVPRPAAWRQAMPETEQVAVLRLCDGEGPATPGWCTAGGELQGPETEAICGGINDKQPTHQGIWRQGNLLHFGFEPSPSQANATGRKLLLNSIAYIARFVSDRPIVRERSFVDPSGSDAPSWRLHWLLGAADVDVQRLAAAFAAPWQQQIAALDLDAARAFVRQRLPALCTEDGRFGFDADALVLGVDVQKDGVLQQLAAMLAGERAEAALRLLRRLLPDGPAADTSPANWRNWLQARRDFLCFDPHSHGWRIDPVAQWRWQPSRELRGAARADGDAVRDAAAVALAERVAVHHGGARALDDLQAFRCAVGERRMLWDRRGGVFRIENTGIVPPGHFATAWKLAIFDTAADTDVVKGGGPSPRPFVSGGGDYRAMVERLFLPLLLLEPGTSLRLLPDDEDGRHRLEVRLGGNGMDPKQVHVLHIDAATSAVVAVDEMPRPGARATTWRIEALTAVGPLLLPTRFVREGRNPQTIEYCEPVWNPEVPKDAASATGMLLGDR